MGFCRSWCLSLLKIHLRRLIGFCVKMIVCASIPIFFKDSPCFKAYFFKDFSSKSFSKKANRLVSSRSEDGFGFNMVKHSFRCHEFDISKWARSVIQVCGLWFSFDIEDLRCMFYSSLKSDSKEFAHMSYFEFKAVNSNPFKI